MSAPLLTAKQLAERLSCSLSFISKEARLGRIETVRLGSALRFTEQAVDEYVERSTKRVTSLVAVRRGRRP